MENINLDAIISDISQPFQDPDEGNWVVDYEGVKDCMKEAIHQALVLASEKATYYHFTGGSRERIGVDKQSILDVEKLIK